MTKEQRDAATAQVRDFYDGPADIIYRTVWGDNLHLGLPQKEQLDTHAIAYTTEYMAHRLTLDASSTILDLGSGYGGPARFLASRYGYRVVGLNLSAVEIEEAEKRTAAADLTQHVTYVLGDFHDLPFGDTTFDVVWSQDALMYGADKRRILEEAARVLKPSGILTFTDLLAPKHLADSDRERLYARVRTPEMWDAERYLTEIQDLDFSIQHVEDWSAHVAANYAWARQRTLDQYDTLTQQIGEGVVERTLDGLAFWVQMAEQGNVGWAFIIAQKPA